MKIQAEYIWLDGKTNSEKQLISQLRSKTKILNEPIKSLTEIPEWWFDGSSTYQAKGYDSDLLLKPVFYCPDPIRGKPNILLMCEVWQDKLTPHPNNTRQILKTAFEKYQQDEPWVGIEQEYTLFRQLSNGKFIPLAWPDRGEPEPQGDYYCGVGYDLIYGRPLIEAHTLVCLRAGLKIAGTNAEVMPGQWEFQIGPLPPLEAADQLWVARWLLHRLGEDLKIKVSFAPKPMKGNWNGAGGHTNFSTKVMRDKNGGLEEIKQACRKLKVFHKEHIAVYGIGNELRLTGKHETCDIHTFKYGIGDRGASVRISKQVAAALAGYLEDRRPAANLDPYLVCTALLETICGQGFKPTL